MRGPPGCFYVFLVIHEFTDTLADYSDLGYAISVLWTQSRSLQAQRVEHRRPAVLQPHRALRHLVVQPQRGIRRMRSNTSVSNIQKIQVVFINIDICQYHFNKSGTFLKSSWT